MNPQVSCIGGLPHSTLISLLYAFSPKSGIPVQDSRKLNCWQRAWKGLIITIPTQKRFYFLLPWFIIWLQRQRA